MTRAVLSRYDAADYLGVSVDTLDRLRAAGAIIACPVSARLVKYRLADLDAYLTTCQISALSKSPPAPTGTSSGSTVDVRAATPEVIAPVLSLHISRAKLAIEKWRRDGYLTWRPAYGKPWLRAVS